MDYPTATKKEWLVRAVNTIAVLMGTNADGVVGNEQALPIPSRVIGTRKNGVAKPCLVQRGVGLIL